MNQLFELGGQKFRASASSSVLPMNIYNWFDWFDHLEVERILKSLFQHHSSKASILLLSPIVTSIHDYWINHSLTICTFVSKVMSLLFNMLSMLVIAFLPKSKHLLISWLQSPSAVILEPPPPPPPPKKICHCFHCLPSIYCELQPR